MPRTLTRRSRNFMHFFLFAGIATSLLTGCQPSVEDDRGQGTIQVQIPLTKSQTGEYELKNLTLDTLSDLRTLAGKAARFFLEPGISHGKLVGKSPEIQFIRNSSGVYIAKDSLSLQMLTLYAHFERLLKQDQTLGIDSVLTWPRQVAVDAKVKPGTGSSENNALYSGENDIFIFVPYRLEGLPLMVNGGVVAHEHFHAYFQKLFIDPIKSDYPSVVGLQLHQPQLETGIPEDEIPHVEADLPAAYHSVLLRGLNEGLADVWGWLYSGDVNFVRRSLPQEKSTRRLDLPVNSFVSPDQLVKMVEGTQNLNRVGLSYAIGNLYARLIKGLIDQRVKEISQLKGKEQSQVFAEVRNEAQRAIIKALPLIRAEYLSVSSKKTLLPPSEFIEIYLTQLQGPVTEAECADLKKRVGVLSEKRRDLLCGSSF